MRIVDVYEDLEEETGRFCGHALFSNEISTLNDDVSRSLLREVTTYPRNETTLKEPRLAVRWSKSMIKVVRETTYLCGT